MKKLPVHTTTNFIVKESTFRSISLPGEQWLPAIGSSSNYFVSNMGRLLTTRKHGKEGWTSVMKPARDGSGYLRTVVDGKTIKVHRIVAQTWVPNPKNLPTVNHINHDRADNRAENLEWMTVRDNILHSHKAGRAANKQGENCGTHKLKEPQVLKIRQMIEMKVPLKQIAQEYGVSYYTIYDIKKRHTWFHI
jgi:hypothetical protein